MPKISVIVPIYNTGNYLKKCVDSIANQTFKDIEIILVDDGSTDDSGKICDEFAEKDNRIRVIHQSNSGSVTARKNGLEIACAEYIGFVDSDDWIESDMYEILYNLITENEADMSCCNRVYEDGKNEIKLTMTEGVFDISNNRQAVFEDFVSLSSDSSGMNLNHSLCNKLFKKELIVNSFSCVSDEQQYGEDFLILCEYLMKCNNIAIKDKVEYHYIKHDESMTHKSIFGSIVKVGNLCNSVNRKFSEYGNFENYSYYTNIYMKKMLRKLLSKIIGRYSLPDNSKIEGRKIAIYGAGRVGEDYYIYLKKNMICDIVAWADTNYLKCKNGFCEIISPDTLVKMDIDIVLIAVLHEDVADEIRRALIHKGIPSEKILWYKPDDFFSY